MSNKAGLKVVKYIKSNKSEKPPADILTKAALLPLQERAVLHVMKELRNGDIEENEEINMKSVNINTAKDDQSGGER